MGYRIAAHVAPPDVEPSRLTELEPALGVRVWSHRAPPLTVVEIWRATRKEPWPLSDFLDQDDLSPAVREQIPPLDATVEILRAHDYGVPGIHGELNLGLQISGLMACRTCSFVTDDEADSLFAVCDRGRVVRVRCVRQDLDMTWAAGSLDVYPMVPSDEDPETAEMFLARTATDALAAIAGVRVHAREREWSNRLHGMVLDELGAELRSPEPIVGLGTWDPPQDLGLRLRARRAPDGRMTDASQGSG
jgi:hypothetical protein